MSAEVTTPLALTVSMGTVTTNAEVDAISPLRLSINGAFVLNGLGTGSIDIATLGKLDRHILEKGFNSIEFQLRFQRIVEAIDSAISANTLNIAALTAVSAQSQAANDSAASVDTRTSIESSYTDPTAVLTASGDGTITIAAHTRRYTDGSSASVNAGSVSGLANETTYTVYYTDASREGGAVTYETSAMVVAQSGNVHVVGRVEVPASGAGNNSGTSPTAPGVPPLDELEPPQDYEIF